MTLNKKLVSALLVSAISFSISSYAFTWPWQHKTTAQNTATADDEKAKPNDNEPTNTTPIRDLDEDTPNSMSDQLIRLYNQPATDSTVVKQLPLDSGLVAIFRQGDWVKVGDRADGTTGWINIPQYQKAKDQYYQKFFQQKSETVYFHAETNSDGKVDIVAYRNGQKLSPEEASALYKRLQAQEKQQTSLFNQADKEMNAVFSAMPGIVILEPAADGQNPAPAVAQTTDAR